MQNKKCFGVIPPIITPVLKNENVDENGLRRLIDYCIDGGVHGLFVAGTNGETMALTQKERNRAISIALDQAHGRVPVMAGVMDTSTRRVIDNIKSLESMGGSLAVVTPIFYDRHTSQSETIRHFEKILENTSADLLIYNIPTFTGLKLTASTVLEIASLDPRVVGYKDSSGSFSDFIHVLQEKRETPFSILQGSTPQAMASLSLGADGFVPALAQLFPAMFSAAYAAGKSGDMAQIWEYNTLIRESSKILSMSKNATAAVKYAVSLRGFTGKQVIWPQDVTSPADERMIERKMEEIDMQFMELQKQGVCAR